MLLIFTKLESYGVSGQVLDLTCLLCIIDVFRWLWMGDLYKNIHLILEFLKVPFLVLQFFSYKLVIFLMMLSVVLLSMPMVLLSTISVIRSDICGNNQNWFLNLNLIYEALWNGTESGLLISMLEKLILFRSTSLITLVLLM